jgi:HlyD family secretion protein
LPDAPEPVARPWWWLPWAVAFVLLCTTVLCAMEAFSSIDDATVKKLAEERGLNLAKDVSSKTAISIPGAPAAAAQADEIALESKGYVVPISLIQISPIITGIVKELYIEEGKFVRKGDTLAVIQDTDFFVSDRDRAIGAQKQAQARIDEMIQYRDQEVEQAKADLDDAIAQRIQANLKYERTKKLRVTGAVAPEDFEAAESGFLSAKARVRNRELAYHLLMKGPRDEKIKAATWELAQAQADEARANWRLENREIKAPINGIILSKKAEKGNIVNPSAFSSGLAASLCEMANLHEMEVDLSISERDISKIFTAQECRIRAEAYPNRTYLGRVSRIMPMGDRSKGAVPVRVKILSFRSLDAKGKELPEDRQGEFLRPEMGAVVTFLNRKG